MKSLDIWILTARYYLENEQPGPVTACYHKATP